MKFAVVVFPGSNCDHDAYHAAKHVLGHDAAFVWHKETSLAGADVVILPGGFAHGDYLRTGAIARFSPVMTSVKAFADAGGPVLGICNGFQILCESGLLPGAMLRNRGLKFICDYVGVRVEETDTPFTAACTKRQVLRIPINHGEGNYYADDTVLDALERRRRRADDGGGQRQRRGAQHRRHLQRAPQRRRHDAAPGARLRDGPGQRPRPRVVRVGGRRARWRRPRRGRAMTIAERRALVGKILFVSAVMMFIAASLIWARVIPMEESSRFYAAVALAAVGVTDVILAMFFLKGGR
jgi:phosphoribosylformylglycinamidine synthase I